MRISRSTGIMKNREIFHLYSKMGHFRPAGSASMIYSGKQTAKIIYLNKPVQRKIIWGF